ncbi:hypothetical protein GQR58_028122 [Nymphon striatum]|nr:hypothetical protein GQR58_028122 [Nymphon striatum]
MSRWDGFPNSWGYKRAGRESGRGRRRKQTCVCVKPVSSERANKEIFCQVTSETARVEKKRSLVVKGVAIGEAGGHEVDTGSERTIISSRVVEGMAGRLKPGRPLLTADGSISRKGRDCRVVIALEGHCFGIPVLVMPELGNLGVDCLLGGDVIDHMGGVTVRRDPHLKYVVSWGNPRPTSCCGMSSDGMSSCIGEWCSGGNPCRVLNALGAIENRRLGLRGSFADGRWS